MTEKLNQTILTFIAIKIIVQLDYSLDPFYETMCHRNTDNTLSQNNIGAFVDLIQGTKEQENNVVKMKEKNIVITSDTHKSVVRKM